MQRETVTSLPTITVSLVDMLGIKRLRSRCALEMVVDRQQNIIIYVHEVYQREFRFSH
jgi:hypothetical protein